MSKNSIYFILLNLIFILSFTSCYDEEGAVEDFVYQYEPTDKALYNQIAAMDSTFWHAYNHCGMETIASLFSEDFEFYHDLNGLRTSKEVLLEAIKTNICGQWTRVKVEGGTEVYPIKGFGAVQFGLHRFHKKEEPDNMSEPSRFVFIWKYDNDKWQITRVISLH